MMIGRSHLLLSRRLYSAGPCGRSQLHLYTREKLGLSLVSFLGLTAFVGCSWSRLNLDSATQDSSSTRESSREHQNGRTSYNESYTRDNDFSVYVRHPHADTQTFEQTVFPGNHTGVARYDTAKFDSSGDLATTDFAAGVLPVPTGCWSIFALLSADDDKSSNPGAISWIRRNIVAAVAGALADAHSTSHPPPSTDFNHALRNALVRLDDDARTGQPWAQNAGRASALLAFFDSESRVLRVANTGPGRAFLGRRASGTTHECTELVGPGSPRYLELEPARAHRVDVEELVNEGVFPSRGPLDASSVETRSIEVCDGDFLVLGSESAWAGMEGTEAVQAVSTWIREQEEPAPGGRRQGPTFGHGFPWENEEDDDFGLGWVGAMVPAMMRNFDAVFSRSQGNPASYVLRRTQLERRAENGSAPDQDDRLTGHLVRHTSSSSRGNGGSVMVVVFADAKSASSYK
ncbi:hypothetical protein H4582DRAFT_1965290 [Lactarius indigo]|nr:hypothetical protein H4582DRAFT_1965290 [Lactarius indigo]